MTSGDEPQLSQGNPVQERGNTLIALVLDGSTSMRHIIDDTIGAYNVYIQNEQTSVDAHFKYFLSVIFNGRSIRTIQPVPIANVLPLNRQTYILGSGTPLYDAVGRAIRDTDEFLRAHPDFATNNHERVLFAIITDGEENASRTYTRAHIFDLLTEKQRRGWGVVYLGANQDAFVEGQRIGITARNTSNFVPSRMRGTSDLLSTATGRLMSGDPDLISDDMRRAMTREEDDNTPR